MKTSIKEDKSNIRTALTDATLHDYKDDEPDESKLRNANWAEQSALALANLAPDNSEVSLAIEVTDKSASVSGSWS